ncbi:DUF2524 domain-containing protein [Paenibacillus sp. N4]|uniref:DUF2524 domain-containing protein n=1 Tax=Paenibacillus vietnamensis TaxID=2590547 RepID=UPI001CD07242|nr:DUF2524 domain-containing protein [Paenibacillus vietnamensis]MCA0753870.1 DUF2524 domain-containing protein [Paenibacillus vietnamensis]
MLNNIESDYNCANASTDLPSLLQELTQLEAAAQGSLSEQEQQQLNRLRNQIHFIRNKCDIPHES